MPHSNNLCYDFDPFRLDVDQRVLTRAGKAVSLPPKATDILILLLRNAGQLVNKEALMKEVWPDTFVEEANVTQNIFTLRRALGDERVGPRYIETVPRRGYRFVADVKSNVDGSQEVPADGVLFQAPPRLAVLPFVNATGDGGLEYLTEGITDSLTNNLSRIDKLRIVSRSGVFRYRGDVDPREVGKALRVDAVLSGKIQQRVNGLGVSAELVEVEHGWLLWGENFDLAVKDILEVQDEIARQISSTLRLKLTGEEEKRITTRYTENSEAYQAYLEGRYHWSKYTKAGIEKAIGHFRLAIELDPNYALAYAGIVDCYLRLATNYLPPEETLSMFARSLSQHSEAGLEIDDEESMARLRLRCEWDWKGAKRELSRAEDLKMTYPAAHQWNFAYMRSHSLLEEERHRWWGSDRSDRHDQMKIHRPLNFRLMMDLTPTEEIQILCTLVREQTQIGNFAAGSLLLKRWWTFGMWPRLDSLSFHASADLLFTVGTLASCLASTGQATHGQKHAEALLSGSIAFFEHLGARLRAAEGRVELARCYYREGLFETARSTLNAALVDIKDRDDELKGNCLVLFGVIERDAGRFRDSFNRLNEATKILGTASPLVTGRYHHEIATTLKELAVSSFCEEYYQEALIHFHQALYALEAIGNHRHIAAAENNLGYLLLSLQRHPESEKHLLRARSLFDHFGDRVRGAQVDDSLAQLYLENGDLILASETISKAVKTLEVSDEDALLAEALTTEGLILCEMRKFYEAKKSFEGAYTVATRCGDHEGAGRALLLMTEKMRPHLKEDEKEEICVELRKYLALTQQASIVTRLQQTLVILRGNTSNSE